MAITHALYNDFKWNLIRLGDLKELRLIQQLEPNPQDLVIETLDSVAIDLVEDWLKENPTLPLRIEGNKVIVTEGELMYADEIIYNFYIKDLLMFSTGAKNNDDAVGFLDKLIPGAEYKLSFEDAGIENLFGVQYRIRKATISYLHYDTNED